MINRLVIVVALVFLASCATRQDAPVDVASQAAELSGEKGTLLLKLKLSPLEC